MHRVIVNEAVIDLTIRPDGPILIKAGDALSGIYPHLPDMAFVRTHYNGADTVYLPGSSLKGVIRSHCERIARTLDPIPPATHRRGVHRLLSCDPLHDEPKGRRDRLDAQQNRLKGCGPWFDDRKKQNETLTTDTIYNESCFICKLFGNTSLASHISFGDAVPVTDEGAADPNETEERNGVAIDRIFGSVAQGPFQFETVVRGAFQTRIVARNFTCAHLGLLGLAFRDLDQQRVLIGFGKSRGLGRVKAKVEKVTLRQYGSPPGWESFTLPELPVDMAPNEWGISEACLSDPEHITTLWRNAAGAWAAFVNPPAEGGH